MKRLVVLASGEGTNLQALLDACAAGEIAAEVVGVVSNRSMSGALVRARAAGIEAVAVASASLSGETRSEYDSRLADAVLDLSPDLVVCAGWMRILSMSFLKHIDHQVINLHPGAPGELAGVDAINRAHVEGRDGLRTRTGVMVHYIVDEGVDDGPVIDWVEVPADRRRGARRPHHPHARRRAPPARRRPDQALRPRRSPMTTDPADRNDALFDRFEALTFDDVVIVPGYSDVLPDTVDTTATFAADIVLTVPIVSAAMDKVTESDMAIAMAREGGIGVIHRNLTDRGPDRRGAEGQAQPERDDHRPGHPAADRHAAGRRRPDAPVPLQRRADHRRLRSAGRHPDQPRHPLLQRRRLRSAGHRVHDQRTTDHRRRGHHASRRPRRSCRSTASRSCRWSTTEQPPDRADHREGHPQAPGVPQRHATTAAGRLRRAAAVGVGADLEDRAEALVARKVDAVAIDTAHGHSAGVIKAIERIKSSWPDLPVVAGNVVTEEGVDALADAGAEAVKGGVGAGSICTTRVVSGAGMPQLSAIHAAARRGLRRGVPIIGDGGITYSGDVVKAIAAGAETVMLGSILAGTDEAPGELELFEGRRYKSYRGMGSIGAMQGLGADRYARRPSRAPRAARSRPPPPPRARLVPEGIEGRGYYAGTLGDVVYQLVGGLRSGMGYAGAATLDGLRSGARFMRVTTAGREESHPHDVTITREAPNYQRGSTPAAPAHPSPSRPPESQPTTRVGDADPAERLTRTRRTRLTPTRSVPADHPSRTTVGLTPADSPARRTRAALRRSTRHRGGATGWSLGGASPTAVVVVGATVVVGNVVSDGRLGHRRDHRGGRVVTTMGTTPGLDLAVAPPSGR